VHRAAAQDAGADQRVRIDVGVAQEQVAIGQHARHAPDGEIGQRRGLVVHLVGEHPQVTGAQPPVLAALEAQDRELGKRRSAVSDSSATTDIGGVDDPL
jgi:hypothetical protein